MCPILHRTERCMSESTPWSPPPALHVQALDLGIKTWDNTQQVTAFSTTQGFPEQDYGAMDTVLDSTCMII